MDVEERAAVAERDAGGVAPTAREAAVPAALLLGLLTLLWTWWAWKEGAYFGVVFYPGAIALCVTLAVLAWIAPWGVRLSKGAAIAVIATLALAGWTLLSAIWSPAPDEAVSDATRVLAYALCFILGLWLCRLLVGRVHLALLPLASAGGLVGVATAIALIGGGDLDRFIEPDGSFLFPLGYRNANAAFFLIALWPALALAAARRVPWWLRGAMLGSACLCADIAVLTQSRGSVPAMFVGVFVWLLVSPWRLRALLWLALAAVPVGIATPWMLDPYQAYQAAEPVLPELEQAGWVILATSAAAACLGALAARLEPAPGDPVAVSRPLFAPLVAGVVATVAAATIGLVAAGEDPVDFLSQRAKEIRTAENPDLAGRGSRFTVSVQSKRSDLWRVAWEDTREEPLLGGGAGGFEYSYLRDRDSDLIARDAHSVELEIASELGFPGVLMLGGIVVGAVAAALRSRRLGAQPAILVAGALACGAYWLAHASIDWFWTYPGLTAPVFALLGAAAAPGLATVPARAKRRRMLAGAGVLVVAVALVPLYLSDRYTNDAYGNWRADLDRAYADLDRAATLNPFSDAPLLAEGAIAREAGDRDRAIEAFREAADRKPDEWAAHYLLAQVLAKEDVAAAREEMERAAELNPQSAKVSRALDDLRAQDEKDSRPPG